MSHVSRIGTAVLIGLLATLGAATGVRAQWFSFERTMTNVGTYDFGFGERLTTGGNVAYTTDYNGLLTGFDVTTGVVTGFNFIIPRWSAFRAPIAGGDGIIVVGVDELIQGAPGDSAVKIVDASTRAVLRTITGSVAHYPYGFFGSILAVAGTRLITGPAEAAALFVFDWTTGAVLSAIPYPAPPYQYGFGSAVAVAGDVLFVQGGTGPTFGQLFVFELPSGSPLGMHPIPGMTLIGTLTGQPLLRGVGGIQQLDRDTGAVIRSFPTGGAVADAGGVLVVADGGGKLSTYDVATGAPRQTIRSLSGSSDFSFGYRLAMAGTRLVAAAPGREIEALDVYNPCGDGLRVVGEQCDDGNVAAGDGCSPRCKLELCGPAPAAGCRRTGATQSRLVLVNKVRDKQDTLTWTWKRGAATATDFGDPTSTTSYALCLYDASAAEQPLLQAAALAGTACGTPPCWQSPLPGKLIYTSIALMPDGMSKVQLKATPGGGTLSVKAKGTPLGPPALPLTLPVIVQLRNTDTGACFEASYAGAVMGNNETRFAAASDP